MWREWIEIKFSRENRFRSLSPSVWREWIEMRMKLPPRRLPDCLPPCGGSGLKWKGHVLNRERYESPSVWREWIEMFQGHELDKEHLVSLRVEGVD